MRTIKFRAWVGDRMEYQVLAGQLGAFYAYQDPNDTACAINTKYPENVPIMQGTSLHDKHGREVYEGDILATSFGNKLVEYEPATGFLGNLVDGENPSDLEIIGDIYENPELLPVKE